MYKLTLTKFKFSIFMALASFIVMQPSMPLEGFTPDRSSNIIIDEKVNSRELDGRAKILADYLAKHNSPLQYHAQDFIDAADSFGMDWKLVPAIAGVESTFGKHIPGGYNAWGWGVYGNQALGFKSWRDGIFTVSGGLKTKYIDRGLTNPYSMNRVYAASPFWGSKVTYFLEDIEKFVNTYPSAKDAELRSYSKEAGSSAQVAFN